MTDQKTHMRQEVEEIPVAIRRLLDQGAKAAADTGAALREKKPDFIVTVARGSSDHAAHFLKYAVEILAGLPVASVGPSVASIYGATLKFGGGAALSISQSGESPDIVALAKGAAAGGALSVALTNTPESPLARAAHNAIDIAAGPELSVAATKTFVNSVVAGLMIIAEWLEDDALKAALEALPDHAEKAVAADWSALSDGFIGRDSLFILGRGPAYGLAHEAALKFKETCSVHAEAYSAAEVMHGPLALVEPGFPVLAFATRDAAHDHMVDAADRLSENGALVFATTDKVKASYPLGFVATGHPLTDALCQIISFYSFVEEFARRSGLNPDQPPRLKKVTETV
ncbi:SIS domain-containing protein [Cucumibacter marinus]|uniref:SIS domain-containing protein n=1 Tax=Cucumibacter marinus TaxID=1121252 RepID=UPI00040FCA4F